jgi:hypothetical protein
MSPNSEAESLLYRGWLQAINFVYSDYDGHIRGPRVVDGFFGLGMTPSTAETTE